MCILLKRLCVLSEIVSEESRLFTLSGKLFSSKDNTPPNGTFRPRYKLEMKDSTAVRIRYLTVCT